MSASGLLRFTKSLLYSVETSDPVTFSAVTVLLIAVTLLACYLPARRASIPWSPCATSN